jgi:stearoyl-CoA desaturase (delta-9 desaturase)
MNSEDTVAAAISRTSVALPKPKKKAPPAKAPPQRQQPAPNANQPEKFVPPPSSLAHKLIMLTAIVAPFVGCILAIVLTWQNGFMGWLYLGMMVIGWQLTGMGVTIGLHRLATHRSFETYPIIRAFWVMLGALSVEGSPIVWCATHRKHHEYSDHHGDPHSPHLHGDSVWGMLRGFWHAHTGWLFSGYWTEKDLQRYVPDLLAERWLVSIDRLYYLWVLATFAIPTAIGGLVTQSWEGAALGFLWGGLVRVFMTHHVTWAINSVCHIFGSRDYDSNDESTNNTICALLGMGEGWHNNHHAFPTSARHGLKWWQFDQSWLTIRAMQMLGLAWNVKVPTERQLAVKSLN